MTYFAVRVIIFTTIIAVSSMQKKQCFLLLGALALGTIFSIVPPLLPVPAANADILGFFSGALSSIAGLFFVLGFGIAAIVGFALAKLAEILLYIIQLGPDKLFASNITYTTGSFIDIGMSITLPLANIIIIFLFLTIAVATILNIRSYSAQTKLLPLIIVAIVINFVPAFMDIVLNAIDVIMKFFLNGMGFGGTDQVLILIEQSISGAMQNIFNIFNFAGSGIVEALLQSTVPALQMGMATVLSWILAISLLGMGLILLFRYPVMWILTILSPIAIACYPIDATKRHIFTPWFSKFTQWAIVGIVASFYLYIGMAFLASVNTIFNSGAGGWYASFSGAGDTFNIDATGKSIGQFLSAILPYWVAELFLLFGFRETCKGFKAASKVTSDIIPDFVKQLGALGIGLGAVALTGGVGAVAGIAGGAAKGAAGKVSQQYNRMATPLGGKVGPIGGSVRTAAPYVQKAGTVAREVYGAAQSTYGTAVGAAQEAQKFAEDTATQIKHAPIAGAMVESSFNGLMASLGKVTGIKPIPNEKQLELFKAMDDNQKVSFLSRTLNRNVKLSAESQLASDGRLMPILEKIHGANYDKIDKELDNLNDTFKNMPEILGKMRINTPQLMRGQSQADRDKFAAGVTADRDKLRSVIKSDLFKSSDARDKNLAISIAENIGKQNDAAFQQILRDGVVVKGLNEAFEEGGALRGQAISRISPTGTQPLQDALKK